MAVESRSTLWVDAGGGATITRINTQGGAAGLLPSILAVVNSDQQQSWEGPLAVNVAPAPVAAQYQPVSAVAILVFTTTAPGVLVELKLVAPQLGIFLSDQRTVDLTNAGIVAVATACVGVLCDVNGNTAVALVAGFLQ